MKRLALILFTFLSVLSCGDEIEFNSPAVQGNKDGELWRAVYYSADIDFGGFIIEGGNNFETIQLITTNDTAGTYNLGDGSGNEATFTNSQGVVYSTNNEPDPSVSIYPNEGQIIVEHVDNDADPKTISGKFWFYAFTADGMNTVNFNEGHFYKVPLVGGLVTVGSGCLEATEATANAAQTYIATDTTAPEYTDVCNAYKDALTAQIDACGDTTGALQALIDSLGDCTP
ncbi:DUF6252 family protein [Gaetbulibacter jejuensis]|uniref:Uncharacterized protein n=1 Tax=Gaetbulibacter jejuensis TaxID=584607 RepID=A0ABN1JFL3_9FLAO